MKIVTCVTCGAPVDQADTVEMPNGLCCDSCYKWLEEMMDEMLERGDE